MRNLDDARLYLAQGPIASYARHGFGLWHVSRAADGVAVGMCGLLKRDSLPDADVGYAFLPNYRSQGFAVESAGAVIGAARTRFGLARLAAVVNPGNTASIRVLEKLGFEYERLFQLNAPSDAAEAPVRLYGRVL